MKEAIARIREKHYIVAIGASAGGLEAIHDFFDHMPETPNLSFVIIQHLSPDYKSLLVDLVSKHTHMKVFEAEDNLPVRKNCIYVIPNNKFITLKGHTLVLTEKLPHKLPNNAIDVFLESLAKEMGQQGVAIILSGTGTDGTKGIKAVKDSGGLVIVQEPTSAKFDGMPNSAIGSGNTDFVLTPQDIPSRVLNYVDENDWIEDDEQIDDETLSRIFHQIRQQAGFDFNYYKSPTIIRRIIHRMRKGGFNTIESYYNFLIGNTEECKLLGKEFLINVTRFFRDQEAFAQLRTAIIPAITENKQPGEQFKIWTCACSTGEEAYSLAILIDEVLHEQGKQNILVKIFATDIEKSNIEIASRGFYPKNIEDDVSAERLTKYFIPHEDGYLISPIIRRQMIFAVHNVIKDPPFIKNDLVTCRNMLIYMNTSLQQRVYSILLFSVNIQGYLFLGPTENPNFIRNHLDEVDGKWKVYRKKMDGKIQPLLMDIVDKRTAPKEFTRPVSGEAKQAPLWAELQDTMMSEFNFAAVYIDRNFEVKEALGKFSEILKLPKKILRLNLIRMLPDTISTILLGEIKNAWKNNEKKWIRNLRLTTEQGEVALQILIKPLQKNQLFDTLIAFHFILLDTIQLDGAPVTTHNNHNGQRDYVLSLEEELNETKGNLQHAIEDLETTNEELQSSNEELLSANEELQSSNEELQSLNEELHTLNTEHQIKIRELVELNDDLNNYFRTSNIGQIFLDKNMIIRKFNPAAVRIINLIDSDIGRPITHISTNVRYDEFIPDIEKVLNKNDTVEKEVQLQNGLNLLLRIMPYISRDQGTDGVVVSFIDITTITNLNNIIRGVFNTSLSGIFALRAVRDHKKQIIDFVLETTNDAAAKMLNMTSDNLKGKHVLRDVKAPFMDNLADQFKRVVDRDTPLHTDIAYDQEKIWFEVTAVKMMDGLVVTYTDITQKKSAEERLKKNYVELVLTKDDLKKLNADLERKVNERTQLLSASEERFRMVSRATNDVVWDWDIVNNSVWFSEALNLKFGHDENNFTRQTWMENVHPDDRREVAQSIQHTINSGATQWTKEYRFITSDGAYRNILDRAYLMKDEHNTPYRMIGSMLDITELKQAEQAVADNISQRKFLAESMPLIVMITDRDANVTFVNNQFEYYTGIDCESAYNDQWKNVIHKDDVVILDGRIHGKNDFNAELRIKHHEGGYHWNLLRAKAQRDDQGAIVNWIITTIDIHDQKQQNEILEQRVEERTLELKRINHALEVSNNDLQQFASVASHDLQEPLRKIHLYSNILQERYAPLLDGGAPYLNKIVASSVRMKSIITNILNYSKLSADHLAFEKTNINGLITNILDDMELLIEEKKATIEVDPFPEMETIPGQVSQVFQNMIGNALKFSAPDRSPVISIKVERIEKKDFEAAPSPSGAFCKIRIIDNGIGFNEKFATQIFVLFQRLHSKDSYEGTGIGLAIAKKIIEKHNGFIRASSIEGQGSEFTIVLPIDQKK